MTADTILAVDLGRYKSVACVYARATRQHTFRTIDTTPEDVGRLLARHPRGGGRGRGVRQRRVGPRPGGVPRARGEGGQHRVRGVEVPAPEAEDGQGRRPPAGRTGGDRPAPD